MNTELLKQATTEQIIQLFMAARSARDVKKKEMEAAYEDANTKLQVLVDEVASRMQAQGADSIKTPHGTVYKAVTRHAGCGDWGAFNKWVVENDKPDFFQRRLTKEAVVNYIEETGITPPGVVITSEHEYRIRKT